MSTRAAVLDGLGDVAERLGELQEDVAALRTEIEAGLVDRPVTPEPEPEPEPEPVAPFPFALHGAYPIAVRAAWEDGFLWKPESESDGNVVVLVSGAIPAGDAVDYYLVHQVETGQWAIEKARPAAGRPGVNGGRHHLRFGRPGHEYHGRCAVVLRLRGDVAYVWRIDAPGNRVEYPAVRAAAYELPAEPDPEPEPGEDDEDPTPGGLGHVLFSEARPADRYGLRNCAVAASVGKGPAEIAVLHPWYDLPGNGATLNERLADFMGRPLNWRREFCLEWVRKAAANGCMWCGVDWEGPFLTLDSLGILQAMATEARRLGVRTIHWPKLGWGHQIGAGQFADTVRAWAWARQWMDGVGLWDPSGTRTSYAAGIAAGRAAGFQGPIVGLAYFGDAKGAPLTEDLKIIGEPWGGIFNPGHQASTELLEAARRVWG